MQRFEGWNSQAWMPLWIFVHDFVDSLTNEQRAMKMAVNSVYALSLCVFMNNEFNRTTYLTYTICIAGMASFYISGYDN